MIYHPKYFYFWLHLVYKGLILVFSHIKKATLEKAIASFEKDKVGKIDFYIC